MDRDIQLLDCTLREAGQDFAGAPTRGGEVVRFEPGEPGQIADCLCDANIDIIELGSIEEHPKDDLGVVTFRNLESASQLIPAGRAKNHMFCVLYVNPYAEELPEWRPSLCDAVRFSIRYSEMEKSFEFCAKAAKKGYKVFIQVALAMRFTTDDLKRVIDAANEMGAYAVHIVDSHGYMWGEDVERIYKQFDEGLDPSIRIGFHAHNNTGRGLSNIFTFLKLQSRKVILDSCIFGVGQSGGNMQTELIAEHLNRLYGANYDMARIWDGCEKIGKFWNQNLWGYSPIYLISAQHSAAYRYAESLRYQYGFSYREIDRFYQNLRELGEEARFRYTMDNLKTVLTHMDYNTEDKKK